MAEQSTFDAAVAALKQMQQAEAGESAPPMESAPEQGAAVDIPPEGQQQEAPVEGEQQPPADGQPAPQTPGVPGEVSPNGQQPDPIAVLRDELANQRGQLQQLTMENQQLRQLIASNGAQQQEQEGTPVQTGTEEEFDREGFGKRLFEGDDPAGAVEALISATLKKSGFDPARMQVVDEYARELNDKRYTQALNDVLNGVVQDYDELNDDPTWQALTVELDNIAQQRPNARVGSGDVDAAALRVLHNKYKTLKTQNEDPEVLYAKVQGNPDMMKRLEQDWLKARMKETPATLGTAASAQPAFTPIEEPPTDEKGARSFAVNLIRKLGIAK